MATASRAQTWPQTSWAVQGPGLGCLGADIPGFGPNTKVAESGAHPMCPGSGSPNLGVPARNMVTLSDT